MSYRCALKLVRRDQPETEWRVWRVRVRCFKIARIRQIEDEQRKNKNGAWSPESNARTVGRSRTFGKKRKREYISNYICVRFCVLFLFRSECFYFIFVSRFVSFAIAVSISVYRFSVLRVPSICLSVLCLLIAFIMHMFYVCF